MNHAPECPYFIGDEAACSCLAGRQVRALETLADQTERIADYLNFLTHHLPDIGKGGV